MKSYLFIADLNKSDIAEFDCTLCCCVFAYLYLCDLFDLLASQVH